MDIDEIKKKLQDRNLMTVSEKIGVHYNTIYRFVNGVGNPNYKTLQLLSNYLKEDHAD
jgi:DNA-binding phage protein